MNDYFFTLNSQFAMYLFLLVIVLVILFVERALNEFNDFFETLLATWLIYTALFMLLEIIIWSGYLINMWLIK